MQTDEVLVSTWALLKLHEEKKEETLPLATCLGIQAM